MKQLIVIVFFFSLPITICAQTVRITEQHTEQQPVELYFKDTIYHLAFDSTCHQVAAIQKPCNFHLVKKMKNIGDHPIIISSVFTSDPHFICDYPLEPLLPGKTYEYKVCFTFPVIRGMQRWNKDMGFILSNGEIIHLKFNGIVTTDSN